MKPKSLIVIVCVLGAAVVLIGCPSIIPTPTVNITGDWTGTIDDSKMGTGSFRMSIVQVEDAFDGTWMSEFGKANTNAGTLTGIINGTNIFATFEPSDIDYCSFAATAIIDDTIISGSYAAIDCSETITGTVVLHKGSTPAEGEEEGVLEGEEEGEGVSPDIQWQRVFEGDFSRVYLIKAPDNGYMIASNVYTKSLDIHLIKLDSNGLASWTKDMGLAASINCAINANDSGYLLAGVGNSDMYVLKIDNQGNPVWSTTFGGTGSDVAYSLVAVPGGGYLIAGSTNSYGAGNSDMFVVKMDSQGKEIWSKTFGGTSHDYASCAANLPEGGFVIAGTTNSFGTVSSDMYVIHIDNDGNLIWSNAFGGTGSDYAYAIVSSSDGGIVVAGCTNSFGAGGNDIYVLKADSQGNEIWSETFGGTKSDTPYAIISAPNAGYAIAGHYAIWRNSSDVGKMYLIRINAQGEERWSANFGLGETSNEIAYAMVRADDGGYVLAGTSESTTKNQLYVVKTKPE